MANYSPCTVTPYIPVEKVTPLELELLRCLNILYELVVDGNSYYFYSKVFGNGTLTDLDYVLDGNTITIDDSFTTVTVALTPEDSVYFNGTELKLISTADIFQNIAIRADLDEIIIEGANYSNKMRQGQFSGYLILIMPQRIYSGDTQTLLKIFRNRHETL